MLFNLYFGKKPKKPEFKKNQKTNEKTKKKLIMPTMVISLIIRYTLLNNLYRINNLLSYKFNLIVNY